MLAKGHRIAIAAGAVGTAMAATTLIAVQTSGAQAVNETTSAVAAAALSGPAPVQLAAARTGQHQPAFVIQPRSLMVKVGAPRPVIPAIPGRKIVEFFGTRGPSWMVAHSGIDYHAKIGTNAYAVFTGKIRAVFVHRAYGNVVELLRKDGVEVWYCHLSRPMVVAGQHINQGQVVGKTGATGNVTGPHLHLEVRVRHIPTDPVQFFNITPGRPAAPPKWAKAYEEEPPAGNSQPMDRR